MTTDRKDREVKIERAFSSRQRLSVLIPCTITLEPRGSVINNYLQPTYVAITTYALAIVNRLEVSKYHYSGTSTFLAAYPRAFV